MTSDKFTNVEIHGEIILKCFYLRYWFRSMTLIIWWSTTIERNMKNQRNTPERYIGSCRWSRINNSWRNDAFLRRKRGCYVRMKKSLRSTVGLKIIENQSGHPKVVQNSGISITDVTGAGEFDLRTTEKSPFYGPPGSPNLHAFLISMWMVSADGVCGSSIGTCTLYSQGRQGCEAGNEERRGRTLIRIFGFPIS